MADAILADVESSGIYQIRNLVNGKRYVGSAIRFSKRRSEHFRDLSRGTHHSQALQRAWDKYGPDAFAFEIVAICDKTDMISLEQREIDAKAEYNTCRTAGSTLGFKPSAESRAKMSAKLMGNRRTKGRKYSREICERMASPKRGRKRPPRSQEWCQKISAAKTGKSVGKGRQVAPETRAKISATLTGRKQELSRRVLDSRLTLAEGTVVRVLGMRLVGASYQSISDATGVSRNLCRLICIRRRYEWVAREISVPLFKSKGWKVNGRRRGVRRKARSDGIKSSCILGLCS